MRSVFSLLKQREEHSNVNFLVHVKHLRRVFKIILNEVVYLINQAQRAFFQIKLVTGKISALPYILLDHFVLFDHLDHF